MGSASGGGDCARAANQGSVEQHLPRVLIGKCSCSSSRDNRLGGVCVALVLVRGVLRGIADVSELTLAGLGRSYARCPNRGMQGRAGRDATTGATSKGR